jgi:uncharacterized protein (TIGR02271 family)
MILLKRNLGSHLSRKINTMTNPGDKKDPVSLNVYEEQAQVDKKIVEKGKVRIVKKVATNDEKINVDLKSEDVEVERVPVNKYVDSAPDVRYEGNTTIIPVIKEVAVVEKKIVLVEEIRITKKINSSEEERTIPLKKEEIIVETSRSK